MVLQVVSGLRNDEVEGVNKRVRAARPETRSVCC